MRNCAVKLCLLAAVILSVLLGLSCAMADTEGNYEYEVVDGKATITSYQNSRYEDVVIPAELGGYPVTEIGKQAFKGAKVRSVTIPDTVTVIGEEAFRQCRLETLTLPGSLTEIGKRAFLKSNLQAVSIPEGVERIGEEVFADCDDLTKLTLPGSLRQIGEEAFSGCRLQAIVIPEGVTEIGEKAFEGYAYFVLLPESLTSIGEDAFNGAFLQMFGAAPGSYAHQWLLDNGWMVTEELEHSGDFWYTREADGTARLLYCDTYEPVLQIPPVLNGLSVTRIGCYGVPLSPKERNLDLVVLPDTVEHVEWSLDFHQADIVASEAVAELLHPLQHAREVLVDADVSEPIAPVTEDLIVSGQEICQG